MKRVPFISTVLWALLVCFAPIAASGQGPDYASLKVGAYLPESDDLKDFDESFYGEIGFGHHYSPNFVVELGAAYFETDGSITGNNASLGNFVIDDKISAIPITVIGKGVVRTGRVEFFGEVGGGVYFAEEKVSLSSSTLGNQSLKDDDVAFGLILGAGANVDISPKTYIGLEGRYFLSEAKFGAAVQGIPVLTKTDLDGFTITLVISNRFRFSE